MFHSVSVVEWGIERGGREVGTWIRNLKSSNWRAVMIPAASAKMMKEMTI